MALPTPLALMSGACVVTAGVVFALTGRPQPPAHPPTSPHTVEAAPTPTPTPTVKPAAPSVRRAAVYVEVFNNSGETGLAARTAARARDAGWKVVGADNWHGSIPSSTVYYPKRLLSAAKLLAHDLGIHRLRPAVAPMRFDRLTVILTHGYIAG
ncbi:MAG: LytR C-terminal domain-containing protein [Nocardioidaceae bacterium]